MKSHRSDIEVPNFSNRAEKIANEKKWKAHLIYFVSNSAYGCAEVLMIVWHRGKYWFLSFFMQRQWIQKFHLQSTAYISIQTFFANGL